MREVIEGLPESGAVVDGAYKNNEQIQSDQSLTGRSFQSSWSLPDVKPNTKIVGVCGISDWENLADPKEDGWFFSDFYLAHHLFKDVSQDQVWLTCVSPEYAVNKYNEYVHGDPSPGSIGSRRVVLDRNMLDSMQDVRTVHPNDLLERVLSTIRQACRQANEENRPVLILIFTHGREDDYTMHMGGGDPQSCPKLAMASFKRAIGSQPLHSGLCLVTTACYGAGWAINPNLNITPLTAQSHFDESLAWPLSGTINKRYCCGPPFGSGIAKILLKLAIDGFGMEDLEGFDQSPTFAGLIKVVEDTLRQFDPRQFDSRKTFNIETESTESPDYSVHQPMFSVQDDEWEVEYSTRTGFPLNAFQARWFQLRAAGRRQTPPGGEHRDGPGGRIFSYDQLLTAVKREGRVYLDSHPGLDRKGKNTALHNSLRRLIDGELIRDIKELAYLRAQVDYRMNSIMAAATTYKNFLDIKLADCHQVDLDKFPQRGHSAFIDALMLLRTYPLFDSPCEQGHSYAKGDEYLAACMVQAGWSKDRQVEKLDTLVKYRGVFLYFLSITYSTMYRG